MTDLTKTSKTARLKPFQNRLKESQPAYGWHLYETLKQNFINANPNASNTEYDAAMHRFARLAGV